MNKPPVNSLSLEMCQALSESVKSIESEGSIHALVLSSSLSTTFSAGLDIAEMYNPDPVRLKEFWKSFQQVHLDLYGSRLACVAAINGHAVAGGCMLALSCDVRIMTSNTSFKIGLNETKLGIVAPPWLGQLCISTIGQRQAEKALSLGTLFSPDEALGIGLVDEVVSENDGDVVARAQEEAIKWNKVPPQARFASKMLVRRQHLDHLQRNRQEDLDHFCRFVQQDSVQGMIGRYLDNVKKRKST